MASGHPCRPAHRGAVQGFGVLAEEGGAPGHREVLRQDHQVRAPAPTASSTRSPAAPRLASGSGPAVIWMAATRMAQGRPPIGHNDQRPAPALRPAPWARNEMSVVSFEDSDVVRSAIRVEGFRDDEFNYQLIRALGVADYGGSTVGECLSVAAEIADGSPSSWAGGLRAPGPARGGPGPGLPRAGSSGQRPGPLSAGLHVLPHGRVLRRRHQWSCPGDGGAEPNLLRRCRRAGRPSRGAPRCALRGRVPPRIPGPPTRRRLGRRARVRHWSGWVASTRAPRSCTSTWEHQAPSGDGTSSCSMVRASPAVCAATRP